MNFDLNEPDRSVRWLKFRYRLGFETLWRDAGTGEMAGLAEVAVLEAQAAAVEWGVR